MSTQRIYDKTLEVIQKRCGNALKQASKHLDIGSGYGSLIEQTKKLFNVESSACDYTDTLMKLPNQKVDIADLNEENLPYPDEQFDIVTCTEVVEHIEHYRKTLREVFRVCKPGATAVFSTPNILNMKSRMRFLWFGFYNLFGPLHVSESELDSTGGHINPLSAFYLAHSLFDAGFTDIEITVDKYQKSSIAPYILLILPLKLFAALAMRKEIKRYKTVDEHNRGIVLAMNSTDVLLGRTIVVSARKP